MRVAASKRTQTRGFAINPNEIAKRIASTQSIEKITKSMKMVSAAKLRGDQARLDAGRVFGTGFDSLFNPAPQAEDASEKVEPHQPKNHLIVPISSDRGLCGGVNTFAVKETKRYLQEATEAGQECKIAVLGGKAESALCRSSEEGTVVACIDELTKNPINFLKCSVAAEQLLALGDYENIPIVYNKFVSAIAYDTLAKDTPNFAAIVRNGEDGAPLPYPLGGFEVEPELGEEALQNLTEYGLAVRLYGLYIDSATSEQSARMNAMENASKNAGEMIDSLTVIYNRARQAKITTELIEIISGAESLKG